ncbi:17571_t:CDS:2 [Rhizophagus irregularis]|nr:17571_t:CDS:2 [Rhizophagus irregularis]
MQNLNDNDKSLSIADNENITSNPSETIKLPEKNSTDTALNLDSDFKNIDSTEEPPIPDSSSSASYQPTSVTPPTPAMTVTTKATTTSTTTTISRQPDKKSKYGFISNLLSSNSSSNSVSTTSSGTDVSKKKSSSMDSGIRFKLFKSWNNNTQDNEYKSIEKALARFQSKDRHKVDVIKSVLIPWLKKYITNRIGSIPQLDTADTYMEIPINTIITYRAALMSTLHYAIDRLNQKGVYSNVISFCARVLALPVSKSHIKRILKETAGEEDSSPERMKEQNEKISALFPEHLKILCFLNLRSWWRQFENAKRIWGEPPIEMSGNWIRRWQSDDSELFFSFYKYYHVVLKSYLASHFTRSVKTATPPFEFITAPGYIHLASFFLLKIESLIHRNIHTITTVIQFEHPRGGGNTNSVIQGGNGISNGMNPNATAIGMGSITNTSIDGGIVANAEANGSVALGGGVTVGAIGVNSGKPKVLEMAGRRFVETMVSIVDNGFFQEMCNIWIKAVVKKTNMYDVEGVFCLLDFIDTLIIELDNRDNIISSESMISHSVSLDNTESSRFIAPNLINILDVPFYISLIKLLLEQSDHSITILRTISFIYTHFFLLTSQAAYLKQLVKEILLDEMFEILFCHWSRNVRIYYMRLLVWRLGRIGGGVGKHDDKKEEVNDSGIIIEDNEEIVIDILVALQSRLENVRQYHEFLSNYTGDMRDIEQAFKAKLAEPTVESITESTVEGNSNKADSSNNEEVQNQQIVEPRNISSSSSVLSVSTSTLSSSSPNKNRRSRLSFKEFAALQQSSGKEMSTAACFVRWIFPNGSHRSSGSHKSNQKQISSTLTTTPQIPTRIRSKAMIQPLARQYATHRHTYAGKAIVEYEAVNQEYAEWCAQIAIIEKGNLGDGNGVNNNIETNSMTVRFPGLAVEYPKYFGNGFGNSPLM